MKYIYALLLASALLAGCGTVNKTAYKATAITVDVVNLAEDVYGDAYRANLISPQNQAKVEQAVNTYNQVLKLDQDVVSTYYSTGATNAALLNQVVLHNTQAELDLYNLIYSVLPANLQAKLPKLN